MYKLSLKVDGSIYPITRLELVDGVPLMAQIKKDGAFENYFNTKSECSNEFDFETALIIEHPKYDALDKLIKTGVRSVLLDLLSEYSGGK